MTFPFPSICPGNSKPLPFAFSNAANVTINSMVTSNTITPIGYDSPALVVPTGCEYSINGGAWTSLATFIQPGQTITIRATAPAAWSSSRQVSISIDTTATTWTITTGSVSGGAWDTGWTAGEWDIWTPTFFNWFRVQLWAPGGGGGGGGGTGNPSGNGGNGAAGAHAQFAYSVTAYGGGGGGGGGGWNAGGFAGGAGSPGTAVNGDNNVTGGGAPGGGGGSGGNGAPGSFTRGGDGGTGGAGGYTIKTYYWAQIAASSPYHVAVFGPGGGGPGGSSPYLVGGNGGTGGYGRCYIDWG
ncbi:hypothetical protein [Rhodopseudomonas palustris]|uniref:hypothetical protein n=1 Tax=Rhodopseudomonas palustris TaxID=1076 RepID=UPI000B29659E|nr:hypothetical protein [Rhodopseudomonas palustris]